MAEALCDVGLSGIAILDVLTDHGNDAVSQLHKKFGIKASFYKVDVRDTENVRAVMAGASSVVDPIPTES